MASYIVGVELTPGGTGVHHISKVFWVSDRFQSVIVDAAGIIDYIANGNVVKVSDGKQETVVEVIRESGRTPFIRTSADQSKRDNLLELPRFRSVN